MKRLAGYTVFTFVLGMLCVLAASAGHARAAQAPAHHAVTWTARTCAAADAYTRHPSRAGLEALVTDSFHVAPKYLGADAGQLYADVEGGAKAKYVAKDEQWIREDCAS